jgi:outer membrane protein OmpA-like peptidoglycan-associated protein
VAPIEARVSGTEGKNTDQDKTLATQGSQINDLDREMSQTKERVTAADSKATQAGEAARVADQKAGNAQQAANGAQKTADDSRSFAEQGFRRVDQNMQSMNKFQAATTESVLFGFNQATLTDDAKAQLDSLAQKTVGMDRYVIEVQGFTDKTGDASYNETLSERRAQVVARYLAGKYEIPVRSIAILGLGYTKPVADDKTQDGRKANRRVEVRLWVPESQSTKTSASTGAGID